MPDYELIVKHLEEGRPHLKNMTKIIDGIGGVVERIGSASATGVAALDRVPRHDLSARSAIADRYAADLASEAPKLAELVARYQLHIRELEAHSDMVHDRLWYAPDSPERVDQEAAGYVDAVLDMSVKARVSMDQMEGVTEALDIAARAWPSAAGPAGQLAAGLRSLQATSAPMLRMGQQMEGIKARGPERPS